MATGSYNLQQQAFVVSVLSNAAASTGGDAGMLQQDLTAKIQSVFGDATAQGYIGSNWSIGWGPVVYVDPSDKKMVADNAMFAAKNGDTGDIVVGIAGTNPVSKFDIGTEDFDVGTLVPFGPAGANANIDQGTLDGVGILEALVDTTQPSDSQTILGWLNNLAPTKANLVIAGHSLGGALSPSLALDLVLNQGLKTSNFTNVYVYPTAGPTPGDANFSKLFGQTFPAVAAPPGGKPWQVWNQVVWNSIDAVPHAWWALDQLEGLYAAFDNIGQVKCIGLAVQDVLDKKLNGVVLAQLPNAQFGGFINESVNVPVHGVTCKWLAQALYQHIPAYFAEIVPEMASYFSAPALPGDACVAVDAWCDGKRVTWNLG
jgi:hypothetical protein